jgi:nitrilase
LNRHFRPTETFPLLAQSENVYIAAAPYTPDAKNSKAQDWETYEVNSAAIRTYAVNSGAVTLWAGVGYSAVYGGNGLELAEISATVDFDEQPFLYADVNTTGFDRSITYNINGEESWGVLKQIEEGWPYYIPKVIGTFVLRKTNLISDLLTFNASTGTS